MIPESLQVMMPDDLLHGDFTDTSPEWARPYRMLAEICKRIDDAELWRDFDLRSQVIFDEFEELETMVWQRYETSVQQRHMTREQVCTELEECAACADVEIDKANGRTPRAVPRPPAGYALDKSL